MKLFHAPQALSYNFGPKHPMKPERLHRARLIGEAVGLQFETPAPFDEELLLKVHDEDYVEVIRQGPAANPDDLMERGIWPGDTPAYEGMHQASVAYSQGTVAAAEAVLAGDNLAISLEGGLHHAQRGHASGFCVYSDPSLAIERLLTKFERVAYMDIDVHHGDGVQAIYYQNPNVLTVSIHQDGRTLYPGTGFVEETGAEDSSLNIPMQPGTSGDVWLQTFRECTIPAIEAFRPEAIVLQMGADPHRDDPLAHLECSVQDWLGAVQTVKEFRLPTVATGGGGYNMLTAPRMWIAAILTLTDQQIPDQIPEQVQAEVGVRHFLDDQESFTRGEGAAYASHVIEANKGLLHLRQR